MLTKKQIDTIDYLMKYEWENLTEEQVKRMADQMEEHVSQMRSSLFTHHEIDYIWTQMILPKLIHVNGKICDSDSAYISACLESLNRYPDQESAEITRNAVEEFCKERERRWAEGLPPIVPGPLDDTGGSDQ